jgi:hypothetical protein
MVLTHYNPTSSNIKVIDILTIKEAEESVLQKSDALSQVEGQSFNEKTSDYNISYIL